jgi:serine O-acetyltransferase
MTAKSMKDRRPTSRPADGSDYLKKWQAVSAEIPDWSREKSRRYWVPGKRLLTAIRSYQRWRQRRGPLAALMRRLAILRHHWWSIVSGADIPVTTNIGGGLLLSHPNGVIVHPDSVIGVNCLIFQQVTIGHGGKKPGSPRLGGHVDVGAGAKILGGIRIGNCVRVGANAVVLDDVPDHSTAVGIPARIISHSHEQVLHNDSPIENNEHITIKALSALLADNLTKLEEDIGCRVILEPLGKLKSGADNTTMALVRTTTGHPKAVISCSRPAAPDLIRRGIEAAEAIRSLIGERLGTAIIKEITSGYVDGRSFVILPWCQELSSWKSRCLLQRWRLRRPLLDWLREATAAAAAAQGHSDTTGQTFNAMLQHLARQNFVDSEIRGAVKKAITRIDSGQWRPLHSFDHNDFWMGNVLLTARSGHTSRHLHPFVVIDWAGANPQGFGLYDLIRLARALKLSPAALRRELLAHCKALQCDPTDARGHLLATFGRLHQHLEYFPEERFVETFRACWITLNWAMPASGLVVARTTIQRGRGSSKTKEVYL